MARIIETEECKRRIIRLSTEDVLSVVREYQNCVKVRSSYSKTVDLLGDIVIYVPEDV